MIRRIRLKKILWATLGLLLLVCAGLGYWFRRPLSYLVNVYQISRLAGQFYAEYEYVAKDIVFDPRFDSRLDVYSPPTGRDHPVLIFIYGGGWDDGNKAMYAIAAQKLLSEQMVVVVPDYTLYPNARYEQMAQEVAAALNWTLANIEQYGGDPGRVVIAGHSAGAHLAGLAVMDPRFLQPYGRSAAEVCGLAGLSGIYDVNLQYRFYNERSPLMTAVMNGVENFGKASPINYVRAGLPPVLLIHGTDDQVVPAGQSTNLHAALQGNGAPSDLRLYPGAGHADFLFEALNQDRPQVVVDVLEFIDRCTTRTAASPAE